MTSRTPLLDEDSREEDHGPDAADTVEEPETKRPRTEEDLGNLDYLEEIDEGYILNIDLVLDSKRQRKLFMHNPGLSGEEDDGGRGGVSEADRGRSGFVQES